MARADRLASRELARLGQELRSARVGAGLSLDEVSRNVGLSASQISRIERSKAPATTILQAVSIGTSLGLDVRVRVFPVGDAVRDQAQLGILARFRRRLPNLSFRTEVPLRMGGDLRAWDGWIDGLEREGRLAGMPLEAESRLGDVQAMTRRLALKMRDDGVDSVLLLVADTRHNRAAVAAAWASLSDMFPVSARSALAALAAGRHPGGSALIFI